MMKTEQRYLLMLDDEYYNGISHGEIDTENYKNCMRFKNTNDILIELNTYKWILEDVYDKYNKIQIISIIHIYKIIHILL